MLWCCLIRAVFNPTASDSRLSRPRIYVWTWLTRSHVSYARLVPQIAHFWIVALLRSLLWGGGE